MLGLGSLLVILIALSVVIFVHELGHMLAAKRSGIGVHEFAIGMGPKVWSRKVGETLYSLRAFPLGGFVRLAGMDGDDSCPKSMNFYNKSIFARFVTISAGAFMNIVLGFLLYVCIYSVYGVPKVSTTIEKVFPNTPAAAQGLQAGDTIRSVAGSSINDVYKDFIVLVQKSNGVPLTLTVDRNGQPVDLTITPTVLSEDVQTPRLGISFESEIVHLNPFAAMALGAERTIVTIDQIFMGLGMLFRGEASVDDLTGPVGFLQVASHELQRGGLYFLNIMALISINLGIINLFPFPVLDGGHIVLLIIEAVRGKALSKAWQNYINQFGVMALISLMAFLIFNDIINWGERINFLKNLSSP